MTLLRIHPFSSLLVSACCVLASALVQGEEGVPEPASSSRCTDAVAVKQLCIKTGVSLWNSGRVTGVNIHELQPGRDEQSKSLLKEKLGGKLKWHMGRGFVFGHQSYMKDYRDKGRAIGVSRQVNDYTVNLTVTDPGVSVRKRIKSLTFDARLATRDDTNGDEALFAFFGVAGSWR